MDPTDSGTCRTIQEHGVTRHDLRNGPHKGIVLGYPSVLCSSMRAICASV